MSLTPTPRVPPPSATGPDTLRTPVTPTLLLCPGTRHQGVDYVLHPVPDRVTRQRDAGNPTLPAPPLDRRSRQVHPAGNLLSRQQSLFSHRSPPTRRYLVGVHHPILSTRYAPADATAFSAHPHRHSTRRPTSRSRHPSSRPPTSPGCTPDTHREGASCGVVRGGCSYVRERLPIDFVGRFVYANNVIARPEAWARKMRVPKRRTQQSVEGVPSRCLGRSLTAEIRTSPTFPDCCKAVPSDGSRCGRRRTLGETRIARVDPARSRRRARLRCPRGAFQGAER